MFLLLKTFMTELSLPLAFTGVNEWNRIATGRESPGKQGMRCRYRKCLQRGGEGRRMTGNQRSWKKREIMEMKDTGRKKQVPPPARWIVYLLLSDLEALPFIVISAALQPYTPILVPCMLQTHSTSAASQSVWPRSGSITQILQICLNALRSSLISSTEHQFPARQMHLTGEVSQYQQHRNMGKSFCTATSGQLMQSPN